MHLDAMYTGCQIIGDFILLPRLSLQKDEKEALGTVEDSWGRMISESHSAPEWGWQNSTPPTPYQAAQHRGSPILPSLMWEV